MKCVTLIITAEVAEDVQPEHAARDIQHVLSLWKYGSNNWGPMSVKPLEEASVYVEVSGGCVTSVYTDHPELLAAEVVDHDNAEAEDPDSGNCPARDAVAWLEEHREFLTEVA